MAAFCQLSGDLPAEVLRLWRWRSCIESDGSNGSSKPGWCRSPGQGPEGTCPSSFWEPLGGGAQEEKLIWDQSPIKVSYFNPYYCRTQAGSSTNLTICAFTSAVKFSHTALAAQCYSVVPKRQYLKQPDTSNKMLFPSSQRNLAEEDSPIRARCSPGECSPGEQPLPSSYMQLGDDTPLREGGEPGDMRHNQECSSAKEVRFQFLVESKHRRCEVEVMPLEQKLAFLTQQRDVCAVKCQTFLDELEAQMAVMDCRSKIVCSRRQLRRGNSRRCMSSPSLI